MPRRVASFDLDINKTNMTTRFNCKDYEDIQLNIRIVQDGQAMDLTGCTFDLGNTLGVTEIINIENDTLKILFNTAGNYGKIAEAEICITDEAGTLKTPSFFFTVAGPSLEKL